MNTKNNFLPLDGSCNNELDILHAIKDYLDKSEEEDPEVRVEQRFFGGGTKMFTVQKIFRNKVGDMIMEVKTVDNEKRYLYPRAGRAPLLRLITGED